MYSEMPMLTVDKFNIHFKQATHRFLKLKLY